jgi:hypothetical protein
MNRSLLFWWTKRMLLGIGCFIILAVLIGFGFETFMRSQASRNHPVLGKLVDIGGRRIQIDCRGEGSPTVVLESGIDNLGSLSWAAVHDEIAQTTRVCAYSRAGILWSDPMSMVMPKGNTLPNAPPLVGQVVEAYFPQNISSFLKGIQSDDAAIAAAGNFRKLGDRPLVVLTATRKLSPDELQAAGMSQEQEIQMQTLWNQLQADLATWSTRSRHEIVPDASHTIQFDRPDVVIKAVNEVVINVRKTKAKN